MQPTVVASAYYLSSSGEAEVGGMAEAQRHKTIPPIGIHVVLRDDSLDPEGILHSAVFHVTPYGYGSAELD